MLGLIQKGDIMIRLKCIMMIITACTFLSIFFAVPAFAGGPINCINSFPSALQNYSKSWCLAYDSCQDGKTQNQRISCCNQAKGQAIGFLQSWNTRCSIPVFANLPMCRGFSAEGYEAGLAANNKVYQYCMNPGSY